MRSRERPVLPRFHGVLKTQPKATEIKVTFVQLCVWGGSLQEAHSVFEAELWGMWVLPLLSPQYREIRRGGGRGCTCGYHSAPRNTLKWV